mmetsp:Transcript_23965/g.49068  ORF Transcript_23965/g.49068 Transcript_23965/m.49068 type:complete len:156 (+) Transcript_23965:118-585(+)
MMRVVIVFLCLALAEGTSLRSEGKMRCPDLEGLKIECSGGTANKVEYYPLTGETKVVDEAARSLSVIEHAGCAAIMIWDNVDNNSPIGFSCVLDYVPGTKRQYAQLDCGQTTVDTPWSAHTIKASWHVGKPGVDLGLVYARDAKMASTALICRLV